VYALAALGVRRGHDRRRWLAPRWSRGR
jgi:hypothetical protein